MRDCKDRPEVQSTIFEAARENRKTRHLGESAARAHYLVSYIGEDEAVFIASCKEILSSYKVFPVCYDKIEVLASSCIVVASPRKEGVLEAVQRKIAEKWAKDLPDYMQADVWHPHTTLLQDMQADLGKIARHLEENFEPFCGEVQTIEFSRVEKVGYTIVDTVELPNA
ncbi:2'-5' RNA ligase family protein [Neglectibacter sp. CSJ-5]|uniref:2'-5' RNA ligase family protein n=1 Tax=Neglectibacter sp. CSJ-5 TaxID=3078043 RepID=UPI002930250B|nr:2'-5' RNA ligase family protein [Neglectibacter sp. CSJ-5]